MATPNIVPQADQEGGLGTAAKSWGNLFIEHPATGADNAAVTIVNQDIDQVSLDIDAAGTTANILDIDSRALTTGKAIFIDSDHLTTGSLINLDVDDALTTSATKSLLVVDYDKSGATAGGQSSITTGLDITMQDATGAAHGSAVITSTGVSVAIDAPNATGTITQTGYSATLTDGDVATTIGYLSNVEDGGIDFKALSSADTADYFSIATTESGATTLTTVDGGATAAHFEIAADGNITLDAAANIALETGTTSANYATMKTRKITVSSSTDGDYDGDVVYFGGTTSMTIGTIYHYKSDGTWEAADADAVATSDGLLGVALGAASDTNGMLLRGMVTLDHDPGAIGDVLYLSTTAGDCSATAPSGNGDIVRIIGYQVSHASNGNIWFNPDNTFVEISA